MNASHPGLDPAWVRAQTRSRPVRAGAVRDRIAAHVDTHAGYVAWSGGRDSTVVAHLATQAHPGVPLVWFDSGLELPDTWDYLTTLAREWDADLHRVAAEPDALSVLAASGAWDHTAAFAPEPVNLHRALITDPAAAAHARFGAGEVTGLRAGESVGRSHLLRPSRGRYDRVDGSRVLAPIWDWSGPDVRAYLAGAGLPEHPAYAKFAAVGAPERAQRVGLVVDGNNPDHGRYTWLRAAYPEVWAQVTTVLPRLREWR